MDLQDVAAELLALPFDQFTPQRNARAKALKQAGQSQLAGEVLRLKKPSVQLWAANQVAREDPSLLRKLGEAARAVGRAQTGASAAPARDLRAASQAFQSALDAAGRAAAKRLQQDRHTASEETLRRVREIFRVGALEEGEIWAQLEKGALLGEPSSGEDVLAMFQAAPPTPRDKGRKVEREEDPHAVRAAERAARMDTQRADQLEDVARRLRSEADAAVEQARRADERARTAEKQAAEARRQADKSARAIAGRRG